jgi:putative transposase
VVKRVEELHRSGVVPLPGKTAFYALIERLTPASTPSGRR